MVFLSKKQENGDFFHDQILVQIGATFLIELVNGDGNRFCGSFVFVNLQNSLRVFSYVSKKIMFMFGSV